ncbi:MAG: sulfite exporter TauE/SafE family protein [Hydrotalea sp.]|nr:sulfite exporter TauE/SafE family protein [Hydrotalea sp.]
MLDFFNIYLPIAGVSINALFLMLIGAGVGVLSGIFGIGGGFIITPLLFFLGVPSNIAVATSANQVLATSVSSTLLQRQSGQIDYKIGNYMLAGGVVSVMVGSLLFASLKSIGQVDLFLRLSYIGFLLFVGMMIWRESFSAISRRKGEDFWHEYIKIPLVSTINLKLKTPIDLSPMSLTFTWGNHLGKRLSQVIKNWFRDLPSVEYFPVSGLKMSIWLPVMLGALIGFFSSILGVGGSIIAIPFMTYVLKMPNRVVVGTSLYQVVFISALTSLMQSMLGRSLDIVLSVLLTIGGVIGAAMGNQLNNKLSPDVLRLLFSCMVLVLATTLLIGLFIVPQSLFLLSIIAP